MKRIKEALIGSFIFLAVIAIVSYGFGVWFFKSHFLPGTKINNFDVSYEDIQSARELLDRSVKSYALAVYIRNNGIEKLTADEAGMEFNGDEDLVSLLKSQDSMLWFMPQDRSIYIKDAFTLNTDMLRASVKNMKCMKDMEDPSNARLVKTDSGFEVISAFMGTKLDEQKVYDMIEDAVRKGKEKVSLEECYVNPEMTDTEDLLKKTGLLKTYKDVIITYDFGDRKETVDYKKIETFLTDYLIDKEKIQAYVQELADKYDTVGADRTFVTYDNRKVSLSGGDYGWKIDVDEETVNLENNIGLGLIDVVEPAYEQKACSRDRNDIGYTYLEIEQSTGKFVFYKDGVPIVETEGIVQGRFRPGVYRIGSSTGSAIIFGEIYQISADTSAVEDYRQMDSISITDVTDSPANIKIDPNLLQASVSNVIPNIAVVVY